MRLAFGPVDLTIGTGILSRFPSSAEVLRTTDFEPGGSELKPSTTFAAALKKLTA